MGKGLYTYNQVRAFAIIGLHNLLNSANKDNINLETFDMFLEPLERVHTKENVVAFSKKLIKNEIEAKKKKEQ